MKKFLTVTGSACRIVAFIGLILWAGQLRVADDSIGGHFVESTRQVWSWAIEQITSSELYSNLRSHLGGKKASRPPQSQPQGEKITSADRDSLMKLLP